MSLKMRNIMKKLVIIGANDFQNQLILKAKSLGYETHVFAWEEKENLAKLMASGTIGRMMVKAHSLLMLFLKSFCNFMLNCIVILRNFTKFL